MGCSSDSLINSRNREFKIKNNIKNIKELERKNNNQNNNEKNDNKNVLLIKNIRKQPKIILIGLDNIGATCYMNSTLQSLSNTVKLTDYFLNNFKYEPDNTSKIMTNEYYKVLKNLWDINNNKNSYSPYEFKEKLSQENIMFAGMTANDSKDLINFLLEKFHSELNLINKDNNYDKNDLNFTQNDQLDESKMLNIFKKEFKMNFNSIISELFYGTLETKSQCLKCKNTKYNFQVYSFIEFPLEKVNKYCFEKGKRKNFNKNENKNPDIDLYECFESYINMELMTGDNQMYCNNCDCLFDSMYGAQLYSVPNYLIINLYRGRGAIYECKVNFPEKLDLTNFVTLKNKNNILELYSVICHIGPSSMNGHFVAYCRSRIDNKWYLYNDAFVSLCENPYDYLKEMPYILFYQAK